MIRWVRTATARNQSRGGSEPTLQLIDQRSGGNVRKLADRLATLREAMAKKAPPAALATMHRATRELTETRRHERAVGEGDTAPGFELSDPQGELVTLAGLLQQGPAVLTFFRGVW